MQRVLVILIISMILVAGVLDGADAWGRRRRRRFAGLERETTDMPEEISSLKVKKEENNQAQEEDLEENKSHADRRPSWA
eukprot:XP_011675520.1 PREDICTED: developmentally-regulated ectodermal protein-like [Strongylocentrotus purpuratus]